jgi:pilus assembly protein TadC
MKIYNEDARVLNQFIFSQSIYIQFLIALPYCLILALIIYLNGTPSQRSALECRNI